MNLRFLEEHVRFDKVFINLSQSHKVYRFKGDYGIPHVIAVPLKTDGELVFELFHTKDNGEKTLIENTDSWFQDLYDAAKKEVDRHYLLKRIVAGRK